jgi:hypothetical protein
VNRLDAGPRPDRVSLASAPASPGRRSCSRIHGRGGQYRGGQGRRVRGADGDAPADHWLRRGLAWLGFVANFISEPVLKGFIASLALTIIPRQLPKRRRCATAAPRQGRFADLVVGRQQIFATSVAWLSHREPNGLPAGRATDRI